MSLANPLRGAPRIHGELRRRYRSNLGRQIIWRGAGDPRLRAGRPFTATTPMGSHRSICSSPGGDLPPNLDDVRDRSSRIYAAWVRLSLSEIRSEHSNGAVRRELGSEKCARRPERAAGAAHPCLRIGASARHCSNPCRKKHMAQMPLAKDHHGERIPAGSSRSAAPYGRSARATGARLAGRECQLRAAAG